METHGVSMNEILQAHEAIWSCTFSYMKPMTLKCAVELGIPDIINKNSHDDDQPILLSKLISQLPISPSKAQFVPRLMRILVHFGFFNAHKLDREEAYSLTPVSRLLLKENTLTASPILLSQLDPLLLAPWQTLATWMKEDKDVTPFEMTNGANLWDCMGREKEFGDTFAESMAIDSRLVAETVLGRCKHAFDGLESLVDVGGGTGVMASAIAEAFPEIKCTVLDLPYLVSDLKGTTNLNFIGGDMFKLVPRANAVLLKWIIHDWSDEEARIILKNCREAIDWCKDEGGKVIIVDMVIDEENKSVEFQVCFDMLMMVNLTGKERNRKEWETLFSTVGFSHWKISPILGARSLIELYP